MGRWLVERVGGCEQVGDDRGGEAAGVGESFVGVGGGGLAVNTAEQDEPAVAFDGKGHGEAFGCRVVDDTGRLPVARRVVAAPELLGQVAGVDLDS